MLVLWTSSHGFQTVRYQALPVISSAFSFKWHKSIAQFCVGMFFFERRQLVIAGFLLDEEKK
jgi:hypothetical protein